MKSNTNARRNASRVETRRWMAILQAAALLAIPAGMLWATMWSPKPSKRSRTRNLSWALKTMTHTVIVLTGALTLTGCGGTPDCDSEDALRMVVNLAHDDAAATLATVGYRVARGFQQIDLEPTLVKMTDYDETADTYSCAATLRVGWWTRAVSRTKCGPPITPALSRYRSWHHVRRDCDVEVIEKAKWKNVYKEPITYTIRPSAQERDRFVVDLNYDPLRIRWNSRNERLPWAWFRQVQESEDLRHEDAKSTVRKHNESLKKLRRRLAEDGKPELALALAAPLDRPERPRPLVAIDLLEANIRPYRFGYEMGQEIEGEPDGANLHGVLYIEAQNPPLPFDRVLVKYTEETGVCAVEGVIDIADFQVDQRGIEHRELTDWLAGRVSERVGPPDVHINELLPAAINDTRHLWLRAVGANERLYGYLWDSSLYDNVIAIEVNADYGHVQLEYHFENSEQCEDIARENTGHTGRGELDADEAPRRMKIPSQI